MGKSPGELGVAIIMQRIRGGGFESGEAPALDPGGDTDAGLETCAVEGP